MGNITCSIHVSNLVSHGEIIIVGPCFAQFSLNLPVLIQFPL